MGQLFDAVRTDLSQIQEHHLYGRVTTVQGMLIEVGGRPGSDEAVDTTAVRFYPALEAFLAQDRNDRSDLATGYAELAQIYPEGDE